MVRAYESGDASYDIVPGAGRMDEAPFVGTGNFGAVYRRADGKVAGVGTAMSLVGTRSYTHPLLDFLWATLGRLGGFSNTGSG
jgi:hypothetical protein